MSEIVERLAAKFATESEGRGVYRLHANLEEDARWWLNAIAEELEAAPTLGDSWSANCTAASANWLREQAKE